MSRRTYSPDEKAAALVVLDFNRGNVKRAAQAAGVPRKTLSQWKDGKGVGAEVIELRQRRGAELADLMEEVAYKMIEGAARPDKIAETPLLDLVKSAAILIEKMQLFLNDASYNSKLLKYTCTNFFIDLLTS